MLTTGDKFQLRSLMRSFISESTPSVQLLDSEGLEIIGVGITQKERLYSIGHLFYSRGDLLIQTNYMINYNNEKVGEIILSNRLKINDWLIFSFITLFLSILTFFFQGRMLRSFSLSIGKHLIDIGTIFSRSRSQQQLSQFYENRVPTNISEVESLIQVIRRMLTTLFNAADLEREAAIGRITAHLSHDLRAPLGAFERLLLTPDEALPGMRGAVKDSLNRLNSMINALRYSEAESLIQRSTSSMDFAYGAEILQAKASERSIQFSVPKEALNGLWIDFLKIERSWINLASNAIEAAKSSVKVETERKGSDLLIRVTDDGPGVPFEVLPRLFHRGMTYGKAGGTGLGLAYVKQIMHGHGGDVTYQREGAFTIFECRLPQAYSENGIDRSDILAVRDTAAKREEAKKVSIKLVPDTLALKVCETLNSYQSNSFSFSCENDDEFDIVVSNDDELLVKAMDDGKEPLQLSETLDHEQIIKRLIHKFNLIQN